VTRRFVGGLLGQWGRLDEKRRSSYSNNAIKNSGRGGNVPADLVRLNAEITDANAAIFDGPPTPSPAASPEYMKYYGARIVKRNLVLDSNET